MSRRDLRIVTRVSEREWEAIQHRARECGLGTSTFLRRLALGNVPRARKRARERELLYELARIGSHLGEIRRSFERDELSETHQLEKALAELTAATRRIR